MNEPFNHLVLLESTIPSKFAPMPVMRVMGVNGEEGLAADRGYGMVVPNFDLSEESLNALKEYEEQRLECFS